MHLIVEIRLCSTRAILRTSRGVGAPLVRPCQAHSQIERREEPCTSKASSTGHLDRVSAQSPTRIGRCKMTVGRLKWANYRVGPDLQLHRSPQIPVAFFRTWAEWQVGFLNGPPNRALARSSVAEAPCVFGIPAESWSLRGAGARNQPDMQFSEA